MLFYGSKKRNTHRKARKPPWLSPVERLLGKLRLIHGCCLERRKSGVQTPPVAPAYHLFFRTFFYVKFLDSPKSSEPYSWKEKGKRGRTSAQICWLNEAVLHHTLC
jgi:hypothetical protein